MNNTNVKPTVIIGIGNEFRCDDAAGIIVARKLRELLPKETYIFESDGDGAELIDKWNGHSNVILIDAVSFGAPTGTVHILNLSTKKFPKETAIHSTHLFSLAEAVETSRVLNNLPENIKIYGIEGKTFEMGDVVSDEVKISVEEVVQKIQKRFSS